MRGSISGSINFLPKDLFKVVIRKRVCVPVQDGTPTMIGGLGSKLGAKTRGYGDARELLLHVAYNQGASPICRVRANNSAFLSNRKPQPYTALTGSINSSIHFFFAFSLFKGDISCHDIYLKLPPTLNISNKLAICLQGTSVTVT